METQDRADLHNKIDNCHAIAWDTCHKIYISMDQKQTDKLREYGYDAIIKAEYTTPRIMYSTVLKWYKDSCCLKFINAVSTDKHGDPDFFTIVPQI